MNKQNIVPVLEKAIDIMEYIGAAPDAVSQPELQKALGISQATCYRIVNTLTERHWLEKHGLKCYDISPGLTKIIGKAELRIEKYRKLQGLMNRIVEKAGFSAKFSVRDCPGTDFVNVCTAKNKKESIVFSDAGFRASMKDLASVSTIFLAEETPKKQRMIIGAEGEKLLEENLRFYRRHNYTFQRGTVESDASYHFDTLSIPVRYNGKLVGVLSFMSLPGALASRTAEVMDSVCDMIPELAEKAD